MVVEFWGVGTATAAPLSMTTANISSHLLADWLPSLPDTASSLLVGWPPVLIDVVPMAVGDCLTLRTEAGRTERQWKSILSWMLGVAGSRHVLEAEGYRWVAPLSAFYRSPFKMLTCHVGTSHFLKARLQQTTLRTAALDCVLIILRLDLFQLTNPMASMSLR